MGAQMLSKVTQTIIPLMLLATGWPTLVSASPGSEADRSIETELLHRQLSFRGVQSYSRSQREWHALRLPPAAVYVVNLWSKTCQPCLAEMAELRTLVEEYRSQSRQEVQFVMIADSPDASKAEIAAFWERPRIPTVSAAACLKMGGTMPLGKGDAQCSLALPDLAPCRSTNAELSGQVLTSKRPITLLLDGDMVIRQAFVGSIRSRLVELSTGIDRLVQVEKPRRNVVARRVVW